jgi:hypothetical protein
MQIILVKPHDSCYRRSGVSEERQGLLSQDAIGLVSHSCTNESLSLSLSLSLQQTISRKPLAHRRDAAV